MGILYPMSTAWVECWKCDECGFRWIKGETWPERCASSKCRKRSWNKSANNVKAQEPSLPPTVTITTMPSAHPVTAPVAHKLDPAKMNPLMAALLSKPPVIAASEPIAIVEFVRCDKKEWSEEDASMLQCTLAIRHRGDCRL